jgi:O-antigen/teichoic acid export membrane protein
MQQSSIKFNAAMNLLNTFARIAVPLITVPYTSRILGPGCSGKIAFVVATTQWFSFAAIAGLGVYASREIAKLRHDQEARTRAALEFAIINAGCVLIAALAFLGCYAALPRLQQEPVLMLAYGCVLLLGIFEFGWFFQGLEDYRYITMRNLMAQILGAIGIFIFIHQSADYVWVGWLTLGAGVLTAMVNVRHFWRLIQPLPRIRLQPARFFRPLGFSFIWYLLAAVQLTADMQIVGWLTDDHSTGLYNAAVRLNKMTLALLTCLAGVLMPRLSHCLASGKHDEYQRLGNLSFRFIWTFGLPAVAGIVLLAPDLVQALAGQRFVGAIPMMRLMAPLIVVVALRDFASGNILYPNHRERWIFGFTLFSAISIPLLGLALLPGSSAPGMMMAGILLGVETVNAIGLLFLASRLFPLDWLSRGNRLAIVNTAIMAVVVVAVHQALLRLPLPADSLTLAAIVRLGGAVLAGLGTYAGLLLWQRDPLMMNPLRPLTRRWMVPPSTPPGEI